MKNRNDKVKKVKEIQNKAKILFEKMADLKETCSKLSEEEIEEELKEIKQLQNEILLLSDQIKK